MVDLLSEFNELKTAAAPQDTLEAYRKLLEKYPSSGAIWSAYAQYLYRMHMVPDLEKAFASSLRSILDVRLWRIYLQHVLQNNIHGDGQVIIQAYEFALSSLGVDISAAAIWQEYIELLRVLPGIEPNTRTEMIRRVYTRALAIPLDNLETLWSNYDLFEQTVNRATAKKMIADRSAAYMTARTNIKTLQELSLESVDRDSLAISEDEPSEWGDARAAGWLRWIEWEQSNPLQLDKTQQSMRVMFAYKKALMSLRYRPEVWLNMAQYCGEVGGDDSMIISLLKQAIEYNPHSVSLSLALAERYEVERKGTEARAVYEALVSGLEEKCTGTAGDDLHVATGKVRFWADRLNLAYVQFMAYCRRNEAIGAARHVFTRARKFSLIGPQVFTASALMEFYTQKNAVIATKIFELGMAKYGSWSVEFVLDYVHFLQTQNDDTNLRALFERAIVQLGREHGVEQLWLAYLEYETKWGGDMSALKALEKRYQEAFPSASTFLDMFERRYQFGSLSVETEGWAAWKLARATANEDPKVLFVKSGGRSCLSIPGTVPEMLITFLGKLPMKFDNGPKVSVDALIDLLTRYQPVQQRVAGSHYERSHRDDHHHNSNSNNSNRKDDQRRSHKRTSTYEQVFDERKQRRTKK